MKLNINKDVQSVDDITFWKSLSVNRNKSK